MLSQFIVAMLILGVAYRMTKEVTANKVIFRSLFPMCFLVFSNASGLVNGMDFGISHIIQSAIFTVPAFIAAIAFWTWRANIKEIKY